VPERFMKSNIELFVKMVKTLIRLCQIINWNSICSNSERIRNRKKTLGNKKKSGCTLGIEVVEYGHVFSNPLNFYISARKGLEDHLMCD